MPKRSRTYLVQAFARFEDFDDRYAALSDTLSRPLTPGSQVAADHARPLGAHVGDNTIAFLAVATDYISAWRRLFVDGRNQPVYAHGGLVRGAFESALMARYLMDPSIDQKERIARALGLSVDDFAERAKYERSRTSLQLPPDDTAPFHRAALRRQMRTNGLEARNRPGLEWLSREYSDGGWIANAMSALAHGRGWVHALSDRANEEWLGGDRYRAYFTADDVLSYQLTRHALTATDRGLSEAEDYVGIGPQSDGQ